MLPGPVHEGRETLGWVLAKDSDRHVSCGWCVGVYMNHRHLHSYVYMGWSWGSKGLSVSSLKQALPFTKQNSSLVSCNSVSYLFIVCDSRSSTCLTHVVDIASFIFQQLLCHQHPWKSSVHGQMYKKYQTHVDFCSFSSIRGQANVECCQGEDKEGDSPQDLQRMQGCAFGQHPTSRSAYW